MVSVECSNPVLNADFTKYAFLEKPGRTMKQASIQFVLANEYISCAVVKVSSVEDAEEVLAAPSAPALELPELENIFETWSGRCYE